MKKEIFFAILLGLTLGLIITYGVYRARISLQRPAKTAPSSPIPEETKPSPAETNLSITSPEDEQVVGQPNLTVAGTTIPDSFVVVFVNEQNYITTADESGNFSVEVKLTETANLIQIHAINEDGRITIKKRSVVYMPEEDWPQETNATQSGEINDEK